MSCASCGEPNAKQLCGGCRSAHYCNETCQKNHWGAHKGPCKATRAAAAAKPPPPPAGPFVLDLHCGHCGRELSDASDSTDKRCGGCTRVGYCGKECQKAHWPAHKAACAEAAKARMWAGEGELEGAEGALKRAMVKAQRELGEEHEETLAHMCTYAEFLRKVARFAESEVLSLKTLAAQRRTLGDEHPDTLTSINNLAILLKNQGKLGEAEPLYRTALAARRRTLGDEHPDTLASINNLASLLHKQGKLGEAEPLYRTALAAQRRTLGDEHPSTLDTLFTVSYTHLTLPTTERV